MSGEEKVAPWPGVLLLDGRGETCKQKKKKETDRRVSEGGKKLASPPGGVDVRKGKLHLSAIVAN